MFFRAVARVECSHETITVQLALQQGDNRETCATHSWSSRTVSYHFGNPHPGQGRWRRWNQHRLRRQDVQAVSRHLKDFAPSLCVVAQRNRHSYENRTRLVPPLPPAAIRGIVPDHRHAAGALNSLELSLGRAQSVSSGCWISDLEAGPITPGPGFSRVCDPERLGRACSLRSRHRAFRLCAKFLAD